MSKIETKVEPRLLNVRGAAQYLSCAVWAVRQLAWQKKVPAMRLGRGIVFDRKDLDAYIERAKLGAA